MNDKWVNDTCMMFHNAFSDIDMNTVKNILTRSKDGGRMMNNLGEYIVPIIKKGNDVVVNFARAQELVRCKDCVYRDVLLDGDYDLWCLKNGAYFDVNDFCSKAERKKDDEAD